MSVGCSSLNVISCFLIIVFGLLVQEAALARPDWTKKHTASDDTYKYYVGRASRAATEKAAVDEALKNAYESALRDNFPVEFSLDSRVYENGRDASVFTVIKDASQRVRFDGFEQKDLHVEQDESGQRWNAWVYYRFSKAAILKERARLEALLQTPGAEGMLPSSSGQCEDGTMLEINTEPQGAEVYVDQLRWGQTPLRLNCQITTGRHELVLDHPKHETLRQDITVIPGKLLKLHYPLKPVMVSLSIDSEPPHAQVRVNGQPQGVTPTEAMELPAGEEIKIELSHNEAETLIQYITLPKTSLQQTRTFQLSLKASSVQFQVSPESSRAFLNGKFMGQTPLGAIACQGENELRIEKKGYVPFEQKINCRGGEKKYLGLITLKKVQHGRHKLAAIYGGSTSTIRDFDVGFTRTGVSYRFQPSSIFGFEFSLAGDHGKKSYQDAEVEISGMSASVGLPFTFYSTTYTPKFLRPSRLSFEIIPEAVFLSHTIKATYIAFDLTKETEPKTQTGYGGSLALECAWPMWGEGRHLILSGRGGWHQYSAIEDVEGEKTISGSIHLGVSW